MSQTSKHTEKRGPKPEESLPEVPKEASGQARKAKEEADDILDKIDEVLEKNAAGFVKSFVQKGGE